MIANNAATAKARVRRSFLSAIIAFMLPIAVSVAPPAHAAEGSLDPTWSGTGKVTTAFGQIAHGNAVAIQSDQKVVVAGEGNGNLAIVRYNADGTLDTSFGTNGKVSTRFSAAFAIAISKSSGRIAVAGATGSDVALAVYTSNGSLDAPFNPGASGGILSPGMVITSISNKRDVGRGVAFDQNDKIVVAGYSEDPSNTGTDDNFDFLVLRYNTNGSLDTSFNGTGKVTTDFGNQSRRRDKGYAVAIDSVGRILVAGESKDNFALARYMSDGALDVTFNASPTGGDRKGTVTTDFGQMDAAYALVIVSGDRAVLAGEAQVDSGFNCPAASPPAIINGRLCRYYDFALARYSSDGVLDLSFGTQGKVTTPIFETNHDDQGRGIAIQPADGKIVVAGATDTSVHTYDKEGKETGGPLMYDFALARYTSEGVLDTTFGNNGKVMTNFGSPNSVNANGVAIQSNGKIVVAGFDESGLDDLIAVARYDGTPPVTIPGAPTGVTAAAGNAQATVSFAAPADNGGSPITGYTVTSNPAGGVDSAAGTTGTTRVITGLVNGTPYTFTVRATNAVGPGVPSAPSNSVTPSTTAVARLSFSVPTLNAGSAAVGQTVSRTLTLSNTGGATAALQASITGQDFTLSVPTTTCGSTLAAGASCSFGVSFTPTAVGARSATLSVVSNDPGSPTKATLTGTGTSPPTGSETSRSNVQKAYVAYYGRAADPAGLDYWASQLDAAGSLDAIIVPFGNSLEFKTRYGGLTNTQLVTKIYQQTLGRDPDQGGLDYYVGELSAGRRTLQSITLDVLFGASTPPDSTVVANKLDVAAYYTAKVAAGCPYGSEQDGVTALVGVTSSPASVTGAKGGINTRCGS